MNNLIRKASGTQLLAVLVETAATATAQTSMRQKLQDFNKPVAQRVTEASQQYLERKANQGAFNAAKATAIEGVVPEGMADANTIGYMSLPDGTIWYYTANIRREIISQSPYYTDYSISGFDLNVYNDSYESV